MERSPCLPVFGILACGLLAVGCSTTIDLKTPLVSEQHPASFSQEPLDVIVSPEVTGNAIHDHLKRYLESSPHWRLRVSPVEPTAAVHRLDWEVLDDSFTSDLSTKRSVVIYLYCSIIDAFLAPFFANMMEWHATQYYEVELRLRDYAEKRAYQHREGLALSERDKTLPAADELKEAMQDLTARNLVTRMLNRMERILAAEGGASHSIE